MSKRWRKQKAGRQEPKRRKRMPGSGDSSSGATGTLGALRRGTQGLFGGKKAGGPKTPLAKFFDGLLWVAVAVAGYVVVSRQCMR